MSGLGSIITAPTRAISSAIGGLFGEQPGQQQEQQMLLPEVEDEVQERDASQIDLIRRRRKQQQSLLSLLSDDNQSPTIL